jgi:hypothetical protein
MKQTLCDMQLKLFLHPMKYIEHAGQFHIKTEQNNKRKASEQQIHGSSPHCLFGFTDKAIEAAVPFVSGNHFLLMRCGEEML